MECNKIIWILVFGGLLALGFGLVPDNAEAQFLGANFPGDYGLNSATQPPPGFWLSALYVRYDGNDLVDRNGDSLAIDPANRGELDVNAYVLGGWYVTRAQLFGGNYGFMVFANFSDNVLEAPILGLTNKTGTGFGDLYVQPINLGWFKDRADYIFGLAFTAPTGRYSPDADDNLGQGMWSYEINAGATLYLDEAKSWNFAATAYFQTSSEKKDTDQKVGNILTIEGGLGKSFAGGGLNIGLAYYAQWKVSQDQLGQAIEEELGGIAPAKNRGYGLGPEAVFAIAPGNKLIGTISLRYLWETGVRSSVEGSIFVLSGAFPIPSMSLE